MLLSIIILYRGGPTLLMCTYKLSYNIFSTYLQCCDHVV